MRPDVPTSSAAPLTVWLGPVRYVFGPGRDVIVGYGPGCDIRLERLATANQPLPPPRPDVVLRFTGTQWMAIDLSHNGIFVNGARMPTVQIRDGLGITIGDPQRGPRLVFQTASRPPGPPPGRPQIPTRSPAPPPQPPTQRDTQRMPVARPQPSVAERPSQPQPWPQTPPPPVAAPPVAPPAPPPIPPPLPPLTQATPPASEDEQAKGPGLIERMVTSKFRTPRPSFRTAEPNATHRLPLEPGARTSGVTAYRLGLTVDGRHTLSDISFTGGLGTLTAVIGPSASRNSALLGLLAGTRDPSSGRITVDGHDVHAEPEAMRSRIGFVARDDRLHRQLTVEQTLGYAAELRLAPDVPPEHRERLVEQILEELELAPHRATRIGKLAPEVRRCASMAVELITRPTMLVVDEPTEGLDAAQQSHVMAILRRQADIGCVVVAAVSSPASLTQLNMCDQLLVLTATGTTAFLGPPLQVESSMGTNDWSNISARLTADPDGAHRAFLAQPTVPTTPPDVAAPWPLPARLPLNRQVRLLARREVRLTFAHRIYFCFLVLLPFALAGLALLIPGDSGLERPKPGSSNLHEAIEILAALNAAAVLIGTALTIGALVREQRIFPREQTVGLSAWAYLIAKVIVLGLAAAILTAIVFAIVVAVKGGPAHGAVLLRNATVELYVSVAATAIVSAVVGLALSTLGRSRREVLLLLAPVILASMLFNGSLVQLVSNWGLQQISWLVPAQWGFAASASTVDLRRVDSLAANVEMWTHYSGWWVFDMMMLALFGAAAAIFTLYRLRPPQKTPRRPSQRDQQEPSRQSR
ncbi:MAG TPA: ATP-binding cassette domain-containing protein [Mycobacterium sp.]